MRRREHEFELGWLAPAYRQPDGTRKDTDMSHPPVGNLINGQWSSGDGLERLDVTSPLDGSVLSSIPLSTPADLDRAVEAATAAFSDWSSLTIRDRAQVA